MCLLKQSVEIRQYVNPCKQHLDSKNWSQSCANLIHMGTWLGCSHTAHMLGFELPSKLPLTLQEGVPPLACLTQVTSQVASSISETTSGQLS